MEYRFSSFHDIVCHFVEKYNANNILRKRENDKIVFFYKDDSIFY